ncbi:uncharacterized protein [Nicotiana sylvestris]|uniref:uncharacterized protein n=1 Tax=Nicotiana sylvestris TaxID=4096 RepID=UPI00388CA7F7
MERILRNIDQAVLRKEWFPITISRNGPKSFPWFFVDDLTLFGRATKKSSEAILTTLEEFNNALGQKVNFKKSKVIFSSNCHEDWANTCISMLGIRKSKDFGKYLGFPIFHKSPTNRDFQLIIDSMNTKLPGLKELEQSEVYQLQKLKKR